MENKQVLVIEDEHEFRQNLVEMLRSVGWQVTEASSGKAGLDRLKSDRPDLVLCDILMPDVDGFVILQTLRSRVETADIPFIFLTGKTASDDLRRGMCQGADDYLLKPIRRSELLETLNVHVQKHQRRQENLAQIYQSQQAIQAQIQMFQLRERESQVWIGGITHDLRAPLTTIKVALELIEQAPEKQAHYLSIARQACNQSDALIEEMLTLYRDEAVESELPADVSNVDFSSFLLTLHQTFSARARLHGLTLEWDSLPLPCPLPFPPLSLQRILMELLNNAFKYTVRSGEIHLQVVMVDPIEVPHLKVVIRNQAEIPSQSMPYIFDKFYRVGDDPGENAPSRTWQNQGSGLGLAIVKQLVDQLRGTLDVVSQSGWTTFILNLPYPGFS